MNAASQRRLTPILTVALAAVGGLWLALLTGWGSEPRWTAVDAATPVPMAGHAAPLPPPVPRSRFAAVWQQPLFNPDRRPAARAGSSAIGELELSGVILTPTLHMALLHDRQGDRQLRLRSGESVPGGNLTLVDVKPRSAVFDTPGGRVELHLPAGAPIDAATPGQDASPAAPAGDAPPADRAPDDTQAQRIRALRETIQKRRAAQAAAVHEGEH